MDKGRRLGSAGTDGPRPGTGQAEKERARDRASERAMEQGNERASEQGMDGERGSEGVREGGGMEGGGWREGRWNYMIMNHKNNKKVGIHKENMDIDEG
jgi:hypothetical protein